MEKLIRRVGVILAWSVMGTAAWTVFGIELETWYRAERELERMRVRIWLVLRQREGERRRTADVDVGDLV